MRYFFVPFVLSLIFTCFHDSAEGQMTGFPFIRTLQTRQYGISNENVSIAQDERGLIYLGTSNGILQYDGYHWERISSRAHPVLTSGKNGTIFTGQYEAFGFLKETSRGISFHSLLDSSLAVKKISGMVRCGNEIFFSAEKTLYSFESMGKTHLRRADSEKEKRPFSGEEDAAPKKNQINTIRTFRGPVSLFELDNKRLFIYVRDGSLYRKKGDRFEVIIHHRHLSSPVIGMIRHQNGEAAVLENGTALMIRKGAPPVSRPLLPGSGKAHTLTDAVSLKNKVALATLSGGLMLTDINGNHQQIVDEAAGLLHSRINRLFTDRSANLWALHPNGVSIINLSSGIQVFNRQKGVEGVVNQVTRFQDDLYLATSRGVYFGSSSGTFRRAGSVQSEAFRFYATDSLLYAATRQGIFQLEGTQASLFYNKFSRQYTSFLQYRHHPGYMLIGLQNGLSLVRYVNGLFIHQGKAKGIEGHVLDMAEDSKGNVWLTTRHNGLYRIKPFTGFDATLAYEKYDEKKIFSRQTEWVKPYALSSGLLFSTSHGLYRFDPGQQRFHRDTSLEINQGRVRIHPVAEAGDQSLWVNTITRDARPSQTLYAWFPNENKNFGPISLSLDPSDDFQIHALHPDHDSLIWIGGNHKLIRLHVGQFLRQKEQPQTLLHRVTISGDSLVHYNFSGMQRKKAAPELSWSQNSVQFNFSVPSYARTSHMLFRTRLRGQEKQWTDWSTSHRRDFSNLREGNYTFEAQSKNGHGMVSPVLKYSFSIRPPFYRAWYAWAGYALILALLIYGIIRWRSYRFAKERRKLEEIIHQRTRALQQEKEKSDRLIERMLPRDTAEELKAGVKTKPYFYNKITVLFGDIQGFTRITEEMGRGMLIEKLSRCFLQFDHIVEKHNIEKIKTVGDAYMAAGGIPDESQTHPVEIILAGMEMQNYMHRVGSGNGGKMWDIRIGVDTGPVVAGVIGRNKLSYDIWGSTVNMASRMEALSEPGKINISGNTYALIKDFFICRYRGKMPVKNSGEIDMYFVEGLRPVFASDSQGLSPNRHFHANLQLLRLNDLEEVVLEKLEGLPNDLYYHNLKHTVDVVTQVELIGKSEGVTSEEMLLLKTAALFHDIGHLVSYDHHEEEGVKMARKMLPKYYYTPGQIDRIAALIMATHMPPNPSDLLEKIICDADLDYLGRTDFMPVAYNLYKELKIRNKVDSFEEWKKIQIDFIRHHSYYTRTAQRLREVNKKRQLEKIKNNHK
ncbi:MAG: HD domain-containing protein [Bacteroidales bacterium]|nr:HD domain-containing protein [Bacteroidales bacterium]